MPVEVTICWNCGGSGRHSDKDGMLQICGVCDGTGEIRTVMPCGH